MFIKILTVINSIHRRVFLNSSGFRETGYFGPLTVNVSRRWKPAGNSIFCGP